MSPILLDDRDHAAREVLAAYGFDARGLDTLRAGVANGSRSAAANVVAGEITALPARDMTSLPCAADAADSDALEAGRTTIRSGQFACVVLNGGMATRFGGAVKGVAEAVDGIMFLEVKLAQVRQAARELSAQIPVALMTSWATDGPTRQLLAGASLPTPQYFSQYVSLRLRPDGELFRTADGRVSLCSTGHGDFLVAFRASGMLQELRSRGVRHVMVSNVDNLAARPDPLVLGMHLLAGRLATLEVVTDATAAGGAPALVDGRTRFLESVQFPSDLDRSGFPVNTNTITFTLDALDRDFTPAWLVVNKMVEGRPAKQFERAYAAGCDVMPTTILRVPSEGPSSRFLPIKTPTDLKEAQPALRALLAGSGAIE